MDGPIASAVMLPEPQEAETPPPAVSPVAGVKRRQSSVSEQDEKRPRMNSIDSEPTRQAVAAANPRAVPRPRKEQGRERRLFGSAFSALSRNPDPAGQARRAEIEKKQRARQQIGNEEDAQAKQRRVAARKAQRQREQQRFEQQSMRLRHQRSHHLAQFLQTKTEPRLYFKPNKLTTDEEAVIKAQLFEANEAISKELEVAESGNKGDRERERHVSRNEEAEHDASAPRSPGEPGRDSHADAPQPPTANGGTDHIAATRHPEVEGDHAGVLDVEAVSGEARPQEPEGIATSHDAAEDGGQDLMDADGEEVMEAAEDTVIY
ncbi:hypothetical protein P154DRAFT_574962 [Amniculicola lignicola CBS 123094]|uniref:Pinin/SDK/MemA protein domain-containing protein n=1 Tax=Amniculicola lignicola CBS 123094 TaxID=1392246 RepID=A0A6A5WL18_9PLEO|nr:hypothetical protein P154DRAFT_574962 [Amniculicola lignicola CBS 123094]